MMSLLVGGTSAVSTNTLKRVRNKVKTKVQLQTPGLKWRIWGKVDLIYRKGCMVNGKRCVQAPSKNSVNTP